MRMSEPQSRNRTRLAADWVVRVLATVVGLLLPMQPAEAHAIETPVAVAAHTYDGHQHTAFSGYSTTECGPPAVDRKSTAYDVKGLRPLGASVRPRPATIWAYSSYDRSVQLAHSDSGSGTNLRAPSGCAADMRVVPGSRCAANSAPKPLSELVSEAHSSIGGVKYLKSFAQTAWGGGGPDAASAAKSLMGKRTAAELAEQGITPRNATAWRDVYQAGVNAGKGRASEGTAQARLDLMNSYLGLLGGG
jgi:hypothetical protein